MLAACVRRGGGRLLCGLPTAEAAAAALLGEVSQLTALQLDSAACSAPSYRVYGRAAAAGSNELGPIFASLMQKNRLLSSTSTSLLAENQTARQQASDSVGECTTKPSRSSGSSSDNHAESAAPAAAPVPPSGRQSTPTGTWLDRLPASWVPYAQLMRLDKPIGTWLLAWPCFWSIGLAAAPGAAPDPRLLGLFGLGAVLLRGAGCTVNDLWDRELDRQVERTRGRPLAAGTVTPPQAVGEARSCRQRAAGTPPLPHQPAVAWSCCLPLRKGLGSQTRPRLPPVVSSMHGPPPPQHTRTHPSPSPAPPPPPPPGAQPFWGPSCRLGWPSCCSSTPTARWWAPPRWRWWPPTR
jgi:hypothetical protein